MNRERNKANKNECETKTKKLGLINKLKGTTFFHYKGLSEKWLKERFKLLMI
ncbi:MAG: hypothetical protein WC290_00730 [archaeon]